VFPVLKKAEQNKKIAHISSSKRSKRFPLRRAIFFMNGFEAYALK